MIKDDRNYHQWLQEYCDCYMETNPKKELEKASKGISGDSERGLFPQSGFCSQKQPKVPVGQQLGISSRRTHRPQSSPGSLTP
jgi:hypothetical protein